MSTVNSEIRFAVQAPSYITSNPSKVLANGEPIFFNNGTYVFGDGTTALNALTVYGSSSAWGSITGTLSNQTDLQNALNAKLDSATAALTYVPYTGATSNVNLGYKSLYSITRGVSSSIGVCLGDSVIASWLSQNSVPSYLIKDTDTGNTITSLAVASNTILQQQTAWTNDVNKANYDYIIVIVGLNDLDPTEAASVAIARYQTLINTINSGKKSTAIVIACTLTPCKQRLINFYGAGPGATAYTKWQDINTAIMGGGANAITGVDYRIDKHTSYLNDSNGNLANVYEVSGTVDGIHPNNLGREIIANIWREELIKIGFLNTNTQKVLNNTWDYDGTLANLTRMAGTSTIKIGSTAGATSNASLYFNQAIPSVSNYGIIGNSTTTQMNATTTVGIAIGNTTQITYTSLLEAYTNGVNISFGTSTGTKIGTATNQKIGFWNATPIVQPTTAVTAATFTANTSGIANDTATFDGYTIGQVVKALRNIGVLA